MESDQFDVHVPDTIPVYITRRHERAARRSVERATRITPLPFRFGRRMAIAAGLIAAMALFAGIVMMWVVWPSPFTYVVVPTAVIVTGIAAGAVFMTRRFGPLGRF